MDHPLDRIKALPLVWDVEGFKDVREGSVVPADPTDGGLQVEEALLLKKRMKRGTDEDDALSVSIQQFASIIHTGRLLGNNNISLETDLKCH